MSPAATPKLRSWPERLMWEAIKLVVKPLRKPEVPIFEVRDCLAPDATNQLIGDLLQGDAPFMVARFGSNELDIARRFRMMGVERLARLDITVRWNYWWTRGQDYYLGNNAGVFPITPEVLRCFCMLMIESMPQVDLLGSWARGENFFMRELDRAKIGMLRDLEPWLHVNPWSRHLAGKKVLVIHPFVETIRRQYAEHRRYLFPDPKVLPEFELKTMASVQSIAGNHPPEYSDWFAAFEAMVEQAVSTEFDVAIIGCGAYGFPLAARLKRAGKQVIHLGGVTQLLFGIKGARWDDYPDVSKFYNAHWTRPAPAERPPGVEKVEDACYW